MTRFLGKEADHIGKMLRVGRCIPFAANHHIRSLHFGHYDGQKSLITYHFARGVLCSHQLNFQVKQVADGSQEAIGISKQRRMHWVTSRARSNPAEVRWSNNKFPWAFKFVQSRQEPGIFKLFHSVATKRLSSLSTHAYDNSGNSNPSSDNAFQSNDKKQTTGSFFGKLLKNLLKALGALLLAAILTAAALPSLLSWVPGRNVALKLEVEKR